MKIKLLKNLFVAMVFAILAEMSQRKRKSLSKVCVV